MLALIVGIIIGFLMCIPIGPINILVINIHLNKSTLKALAVAFGGSLMDFVYFYIILSGISFFDFNDSLQFIFKLGGTLLIFGLGVKELLKKEAKLKLKTKKDVPQDLISGTLLGIVVYTSNPTLIFTMTALASFLKSLEVFDLNFLNIMAVSLGLSLGSFLWFLFLLNLVDKYEYIIRDKFLNLFNKLSGGLLIALSLLMGYKLYY